MLTSSRAPPPARRPSPIQVEAERHGPRRDVDSDDVRRVYPELPASSADRNRLLARTSSTESNDDNMRLGDSALDLPVAVEVEMPVVARGSVGSRSTGSNGSARSNGSRLASRGANSAPPQRQPALAAPAGARGPRRTATAGAAARGGLTPAARAHLREQYGFK